jgi:hypothetical protein
MINDENAKPEQNSDAPQEETPTTWTMPEPVFRTSEGTRYISDADGEKTLEPQPQTQTSAPPQVKSSRMPFILSAAFIIFFGVAVLLTGIWFLFLKDIKPPKILTPEVEKSTPTPEPAVAPTKTPDSTATPTPDPGGAPII